MGNPYENEVQIVFKEGELQNLKAVNYALNTLNSISDFNDLMTVATSERNLKIELKPFGFGGSAYEPETNTIYIDFKQTAGTLIQGKSGETQKVSLQEVIIHELVHAVQEVDSTAAAIASSGIATQIISDYILEPRAINLTNQFRTTYLGVDERTGHTAQFDRDLVENGLFILGMPEDGFAPIALNDISDLYLNNNLPGFVFESNYFSGIGFGESFIDLPLHLQKQLQGLQFASYDSVGFLTVTKIVNGQEKNVVLKNVYRGGPSF